MTTGVNPSFLTAPEVASKEKPRKLGINSRASAPDARKTESLRGWTEKDAETFAADITA